eukprot:12029055-Heterocapsa_arctica.AAC.1
MSLFKHFENDTDNVLGIVVLGEAGACLDTTGGEEKQFQQVLPGKIRAFHTPSHSYIFHVQPCAIVFGKIKEQTPHLLTF